MKLLLLIGLLFTTLNGQQRRGYSRGGRIRINSGQTGSTGNCNSGRIEVYGATGWGALQDCSTVSLSYSSWYTRTDADQFCQGMGYDYAEGSTSTISGAAIKGSSNYLFYSSGVRSFSTLQTAYSYFDSLGCISSSSSVTPYTSYSSSFSFCDDCGDEFSRSAASSTWGDSSSSNACSSSTAYNVFVLNCARCSVSANARRNSTDGSIYCTDNTATLYTPAPGYSCTTTTRTPTSSCYRAYGGSTISAAAVAALAAWLIWMIVIISICCLVIIIVICVCIFGGVACCAAAASPTPVAGQPVVMTTTNTV